MDSFEEYWQGLAKDKVEKAAEDKSKSFMDSLPKLKTRKIQTQTKTLPKWKPIGFENFCHPAKLLLDKENYSNIIKLNLDSYTSYFTSENWRWIWRPAFCPPSLSGSEYLTLVPRPVGFSQYFSAGLANVVLDTENPGDIQSVDFDLESIFWKNDHIKLGGKVCLEVFDPQDNYVQASEISAKDFNFGGELKWDDTLQGSFRTSHRCDGLEFTLYKSFGELEICAQAEVQLSDVRKPLYNFATRFNAAPGLYIQAALKTSILNQGWNILSNFNYLINETEGRSWCVEVGWTCTYDQI